MRAAARYVLVLAAVGPALLVLGPSLSDGEEGPVPARAAASSPPAAPPRTTAESPLPARPQERPGLLLPASGGDGDSWRDTEGREYRLGLVNTPETSECFGAEATRERTALTAGGFSADVYTRDRYGRGVAVVHTADGRDLNVHLARYGFADDRYLAEFRDEDAQLAARLDTAFAAARAERRGLWAACAGPPAAPVPDPPVALEGSAPPTDPAGDCHPDYATCLPVRGDGSGHGRSNDLDCGSTAGGVHLRRAGVDPYRLDADGDGLGCDA